MRNVGTNSEVIDAFFDPEAEGPHRNGGNTVYWNKDKDTLYSYGPHFPLAHRHHSGCYLFNGDVYSPTTSAHQRSAATHREDTRGDITISFTALEAAGIDYGSKRLRIIASEQDMEKWFDWYHGDERPKAQVLEAAKKFEAEAPRGATIIYRNVYLDGSDTKGTRIPQQWHRPPAAVLHWEAWTQTRTILVEGPDGNQWEKQTIDHPDTFWILGMDEGSYFISQLENYVDSVKAAYDMLKPVYVHDAEARGLKVHRQGEWFFFKVLEGKAAKRIYKQMGQKLDLTDASNREGAAHTATRGSRLNEIAFDPETKAELVKAMTFINPNQLIVSGSITHSEGDHARLRLSLAKDPAIFAAHVNTALASYSASGQVD